MYFLKSKHWKGKGGQVLTFPFAGKWYTLVYTLDGGPPQEIISRTQKQAYELFEQMREEIALQYLPNTATKLRITISVKKTLWAKRESRVEEMRSDPSVTVEKWQEAKTSLENHRQYYERDLAALERKLQDCFYKKGEKIRWE
jgi:hypothetical protein